MAPVSKPSSQKVLPSHGKSVTQTKPSHPVAASKPHVETRSRQTTKLQAVGKQQPAKATRSTSRGAKTEHVEKSHKKVLIELKILVLNSTIDSKYF